MIFPVKRVKEELVKEFSVSKLDITTFSEMHNIDPEALRSWIKEAMYPTPSKDEVFSSTDFVELDIPKVSKQSINLSKNRNKLITVRAGGIEIDIPIETCETNLFKILQTAASI
jgi:hypothetical protein